MILFGIGIERAHLMAVQRLHTAIRARNIQAMPRSVA